MTPCEREFLSLDLPNGFVVGLEEVSGKRELLIWVGPGEGILLIDLQRLKRSGEIPQRPGTYDIMNGIAKAVDMEARKAVISEIKDNTFYAKIHFQRKLDDGWEEIRMDVRPSNAIPFAIAADVSLFVEEAVLKEGGVIPDENPCEGCGSCGSLPCGGKEGEA